MHYYYIKFIETHWQAHKTLDIACTVRGKSNYHNDGCHSDCVNHFDPLYLMMQIMKHNITKWDRYINYSKLHITSMMQRNVALLICFKCLKKKGEGES